MEKDKGHEQLLKDLNRLLKEAEEYQFHDYKNEKYEMPKQKLFSMLNQLMDNIRSGKYDN